MAIGAPSRIRLQLHGRRDFGDLCISCRAHAASPGPTRCRSASRRSHWSTVKYATSEENGLIDGSLDKNTIVDRKFKARVLENRYLKVVLLPEFGGRILSIIYKPTGHEQLYRTEVGVPYGMGEGNFYYDWLMVYGGIFPTFPDAEHGRTWLEAVGFQGRESRAPAK